MAEPTLQADDGRRFHLTSVVTKEGAAKSRGRGTARHKRMVSGLSPVG